MTSFSYFFSSFKQQQNVLFPKSLEIKCANKGGKETEKERERNERKRKSDGNFPRF